MAILISQDTVQYQFLQTTFTLIPTSGKNYFLNSNESTNKMQQLITGLLFVVWIPLNMFRASLCPSSGAYQLQQQQQPLV